MHIKNISTRTQIAKIFDLGDKFICPTQLVKLFGSAATAEPCIVICPTPMGIQTREDMSIVELTSEDVPGADWAHNSNKLFNLFDVGEGWVFSKGKETLGSMAKGISSNIFRFKKISTSRQMAVIINRLTGEVTMGYYLERTEAKAKQPCTESA